jgi:F-type H+-transporting ATPase subunit a
MFSSSFILSPLSQFEVNSLIGFNAPILGFFNLSLTNLGLYTLFTLFIILGVHIYGNNDSKLIPSKWSIAFESSFQSLGTMVRDQIGSLNEIYLPFIYAIF